MEDKSTVDYDFGSVFGSIMKVVEVAGDDGSDVDGQNNSNEWKQDVGERSRQVYGWWRMLVNERKDSVPCFLRAATLVAIVQVSSAAIERIYSQLTFHSPGSRR